MFPFVCFEILSFQALSKKLVPRTTLLIGACVELLVVVLLSLFLPLANFRYFVVILTYRIGNLLFVF